MEPANPLHAEIRRHVREVQRTRRATNRMPADALVIRDGLMLKTRFSQSLTAFRAVLEEMVALRLIEIGRTINDTYVRVIEDLSITKCSKNYSEMDMKKRIIRVFPTKTNATPTDELVRIRETPSFFDEADEVHVSVTFTWDIPIAEWLAKQWEPVADRKSVV